MCSTRCSQKYDVFMSLSPFYTVYICHDEVCLLRFIRPNSSLSSQLRATCPWKSCFKHKWQLLLEFEGISLQLIIFVDTVLLSCSITETLTHSAALCYMSVCQPSWVWQTWRCICTITERLEKKSAGVDCLLSSIQKNTLFLLLTKQRIKRVLP